MATNFLKLDEKTGLGHNGNSERLDKIHDFELPVGSFKVKTVTLCSKLISVFPQLNVIEVVYSKDCSYGCIPQGTDKDLNF